ncbi:MAG: hypothetical protein QXW37_05430 [Candidatus Nitrosotenuis sp.]
MSDIPLQIRKVIFEKYNDPDIRFTNDEIFSILKKDNIIDNSLTIDDMEPHFKTLCDVGVMRNIAQNFTTQWFKLFEPLEKINCPTCRMEVHLGKSEDRTCPNSSCRAAI